MKLKKNDSVIFNLIALSNLIAILIAGCARPVDKTDFIVIADDRHSDYTRIWVVFKEGESYFRDRVAPMQPTKVISDKKWVAIEGNKGKAIFDLFCETGSEIDPPLPPGGGALITANFISSTGAKIEVRRYDKNKRIIHILSSVAKNRVDGDASKSLKKRLDSVSKLTNDLKLLVTESP
jgi:hypothetical protein